MSYSTKYSQSRRSNSGLTKKRRDISAWEEKSDLNKNCNSAVIDALTSVMYQNSKLVYFQKRWILVYMHEYKIRKTLNSV